MTVRRKESARRSMLAVVAAVAVAMAGGCGGERAPRDAADANEPASTSASGSPGTPPDLVRLVYESTESGEPESLELIVDGNRRYRVTSLTGPGAGHYLVWDGTALLIYNPDEDPKYMRDDQPDAEYVQEADRKTFFFRSATAEFDTLCPQARRLGTKKQYGRTLVRYACATRPADVEMGKEATGPREIALDEQTGLLLVDGAEAPTEVTFGATIKADTFSTAVAPGGDEPTAVPPDTGEEGTVPPDEGEQVNPTLGAFRLPAVGGGFVADTSYRGKPLVLVAGSPSSLKPALARVLPLTSGGVKPAVIGVLIAVPPSDWKGSLANPEDEKAYVESVAKTAGPFSVPVGVDVKGAAVGQIVEGLPWLIPPEGSTETAAAIALVRSDGTVAQAKLAADATDAQLRGWLAKLS